jgi:hypothetical protein
MKFLSRRMMRQKVNGNGIRAAGELQRNDAQGHSPVE